LSAGFPADEFATAKNAFLEERKSVRSEDAQLVAILARNAQYGWTMARDAEIESKIAALTADDVVAALKQHIDPAAISIVKGGDFHTPAQ